MEKTQQLAFEEALNRVVARGVRLAVLLHEDTVYTTNGIPKPKAPGVRRDQSLRLTQVAEVLDLLQWYGPWGTTIHGIEMELIRRAKETR